MNVTDEVPASAVTDLGVLKEDVLESVSVMEGFPGGGAFRDTWQVVELPGRTLVGVHESDVTKIGTTVRVTMAVEAPNEAVIEPVC